MKNIYLIGPRACGKTTLGKDLAKRLGMTFTDTDDRIVRKAGETIAEYVEKHGWEAFRDLESDVLLECHELAPMVVACGGGMVLREQNRDLLRRGAVFYLQVDPEELTRRLCADPLEAQRPALTNKGLLEEIRDVIAERAALYEECAGHILLLDTYDNMLDQAEEEARTLLK